MRQLVLSVGLMTLVAGCAGNYLVPLNGQSDAQRRADGKECQQLAVASAHDARERMLESIRRANEKKTTGERTGEIVGTVALALVVPFYAQPTPPAEEVYWAAFHETYTSCYESRGYRYATPEDYK